MKMSRSTIINLPPETVWREVQTARLLQHIARPIMRFVPVGDDNFDMFKPGGTYQVKLRMFGLIPFGKQWIVTSLHQTGPSVWPKKLRDDGYSALIHKWDHWITIAPGDDGTTHYIDDVEISARILTPFVWGFAQFFYWHRQRRWRGLASTLRSRQLIATEMTAYANARTTGKPEIAWQHLERAHILSQPYLGLHLANHWAMLKFAAEERNVREVAGQLLRIALAPLGALTGRIPIGNTGRSNVSAFQAMPIPKDLRDALAKDDQ